MYVYAFCLLKNDTYQFRFLRILFLFGMETKMKENIIFLKGLKNCFKVYINSEEKDSCQWNNFKTHQMISRDKEMRKDTGAFLFT